MQQTLICLIVCLTFIGILVLAVFCWRWWLQHGLDKFLESEAKRLAEHNAELKRRIRRHKNKIHQLQRLIDKYDNEIDELEYQVDDLEEINQDLINQLGGDECQD